MSGNGQSQRGKSRFIASGMQVRKYVLVYGRHYFASRNQNFKYKGGIFFLKSKTEDTEQQDSVAASEVSSWTS